MEGITTTTTEIITLIICALAPIIGVCAVLFLFWEIAKVMKEEREEKE